MYIYFRNTFRKLQFFAIRSRFNSTVWSSQDIKMHQIWLLMWNIAKIDLYETIIQKMIEKNPEDSIFLWVKFPRLTLLTFSFMSIIMTFSYKASESAYHNVINAQWRISHIDQRKSCLKIKFSKNSKYFYHSFIYVFNFINGTCIKITSKTVFE